MLNKINPSSRAVRVLAISSGGGHWEQLMMLRNAFTDCDASFATTLPSLLEHAGLRNGHLVHDCHRGDLVGLAKCARSCLRLLTAIRPDVVVSTGAAPGLLCLLIARAFGAKTIWIDSVANAERLSMSGKIAQRLADVCLTQWQHLARPGGPHFAGAVL